MSSEVSRDDIDRAVMLLEKAQTVERSTTDRSREELIHEAIRELDGTPNDELRPMAETWLDQYEQYIKGCGSELQAVINDEEPPLDYNYD